MSTAEALKNAGNTEFAAGRVTEAAIKFTAAVKAMETETKKDEDTTAHPQAAAIYSNRSACYLKQKKFIEALHDANRALVAKPDWWKAHCRRAFALEGLEQHEDCLASLNTALEMEPDNDEMRAKHRQITVIVAQNKQNPSDSKAPKPEAGQKLGAPQVHGNWRNTANSTSSQIPPTRGSRKELSLLVRPTILDCMPSESNRPLFFPAVPIWPRDPETFAGFLSNVSDPTGRTPPQQELTYLMKMSAQAWLNQHEADRTFRNDKNVPARCEFCQIDMSKFKADPPSCECGEQYCSRQCMELDWRDHKPICNKIREQSPSLNMFHKLFWQGCCYGLISWSGQRVRNFSTVFHNAKAADGMDEFSYLMVHERNAVTTVLTELQAEVKNAVASGDLWRKDCATENLCACLLELYLRLTSYDENFDSFPRIQFKLAMAEMLHSVMKQFNLAVYVEPLETVVHRFAPAMDKARAFLDRMPPEQAQFQAMLQKMGVTPEMIQKQLGGQSNNKKAVGKQ